MVISINGKSLVKRFSDWMFKTVTICDLQSRSEMINMDESHKHNVVFWELKKDNIMTQFI